MRAKGPISKISSVKTFLQGRWTVAASTCLVAIMLAAPRIADAQETGTVDGASGVTAAGETPASTYLFAGIGAFIPLRESFRLNYSTSLGGIPVELLGGFVFPVSNSVLAPVAVRYLRRTANFLSSTSIAIVSVEPGVRVYIEKQRLKDVRVFAGFEGIVAQASVHGLIDASQDGTVTGRADAAKDYFDVGLGVDLGFTYPLGPTTALDGIVHASVYLGSPLAHGGLGNIGGVSLDIAYRFGF